jgi:hypothetical protein
LLPLGGPISAYLRRLNRLYCMREKGSFKMLCLSVLMVSTLFSKMTKAKRLNDSTAHFLYAVVACIFDQRLQIVYHIYFKPLRLNWKLI